MDKGGTYKYTSVRMIKAIQYVYYVYINRNNDSSTKSERAVCEFLKENAGSKYKAISFSKKDGFCIFHLDECDGSLPMDIYVGNRDYITVDCDDGIPFIDVWKEANFEEQFTKIEESEIQDNLKNIFGAKHSQLIQPERIKL